METIATYEKVAEACQAISDRRETPTDRKIIKYLGGGSMETVGPHRRRWFELRDQASKIQDSMISPSLLMAIRAEISRHREEVSEQARGTLESTKAEAQDNWDSAVEFESRCHDLQRDLNNAQVSLTAAEAREQVLRENLADAIRERDERAGAVENARREAFSLSAAAEELRKKGAQASAEVEALKDRVQQLQTQLAAEERRSAVWETQLKGAADRVELLKAQAEDASRQREKTLADLADARIAKDVAEHDAVSARTQLADVRAELTELKANLRISRTKQKVDKQPTGARKRGRPSAATSRPDDVAREIESPA